MRESYRILIKGVEMPIIERGITNVAAKDGALFLYDEHGLRTIIGAAKLLIISRLDLEGEMR